MKKTKTCGKDCDCIDNLHCAFGVPVKVEGLESMQGLSLRIQFDNPEERDLFILNNESVIK